MDGNTNKPEEERAKEQAKGQAPLTIEELLALFPHAEQGIKKALHLGKDNDPTRKYRKRVKAVSRKQKAGMEPVNVNTELIKAVGRTSVMRNNALLPFSDAVGVDLIRLRQELQEQRDAIQSQKSNTYCKLIFILQHLCDRANNGEDTHGITVKQDGDERVRFTGTLSDICSIPCLELKGEHRSRVKGWLSLSENCPVSYIVQGFVPDPGREERYILREWFLHIEKTLTKETAYCEADEPQKGAFVLSVNRKYLTLLSEAGDSYAKIPLGLQSMIERMVKRAKRAQGSDPGAELCRMAYAATGSNGALVDKDQAAISSALSDWISSLRDFQPYIGALMKIKKTYNASRNGGRTLEHQAKRQKSGHITFTLKDNPANTGKSLVEYFPARAQESREDRKRITGILWAILNEARLTLGFFDGRKVNVKANGDSGELRLEWSEPL